MARELGPDNPEYIGVAADVMAAAEKLRDDAQALFKKTLALFAAHERRQEVSAEGFRAHTRTEARGVPCGGEWVRFNEPAHHPIPADGCWDEGEGPE